MRRQGGDGAHGFQRCMENFCNWQIQSRKQKKKGPTQWAGPFG
jgi:hypothetical protein